MSSNGFVGESWDLHRTRPTGMGWLPRAVAWILMAGLARGASPADIRAPVRGAWFEIQVIDQTTRRGVPLVELETVDRVKYVSDNAGRVAVGDPGLMGQAVYFQVRSHGYEFPKDGFGFAGVRLAVVAGGRATVELKRLNVAERLYRITGAGLYRDSVLLGFEVPLAEPLLNAQVVGQDSAQAVLRGDTIYWFWGDTSRAAYPLGNFRTTGATAGLPGKGGLDPTLGIDLHYRTAADGFTQQMCPFEPKEGVVWIDGLALVAVGDGQERMVARFMRLRRLGEPLEHGLVCFDDKRGEFTRDVAYRMPEDWRCPRGQATRVTQDEGDWVYFCTPFPTVRVPAKLEAMRRPEAYEAWSCLEDGSSPAPAGARVKRREDGSPAWRWTALAPPLTPGQEGALVDAGLLERSDCTGSPVDVESGIVVKLHGGTVRWNTWRKCWVLIAVQQGGTSFLGEVWYGEASAITGPWRKVRKIVTHDRYTFYNPVHHAFLDQGGGRFVFFEGTYSREFSGNLEATPRYDYNQVMYRLDLDDSRLGVVRQ